MSHRGNPVERERRLRIRLAVAAYAYEIENDSVMSDAMFDRLSLRVNPKRSTGHAEIDAFFREHFDPCTGSWIHRHPDLPGVRRTYLLVKRLLKR